MYACAVACSIPKWNLHVVPVSSLFRVQSKLSFRMLNCHVASSDSRGCSRRFIAGEADVVTAHGCLEIAQQFRPSILPNNCFHQQACSNQTIMKSNWCVALTDTFESVTRKYGFLNRRNARFLNFTRENYKFECAEAYGSLLDFNCHSVSHEQRNGAGLWCLMKRAFLCYLSLPRTDDLAFFSNIQRRLIVSCSFKKNTRSVSQKPDGDSHEKPSAAQLNIVQQIMIQQVTVFAVEHYTHCCRDFVCLVSSVQALYISL